MSSSFSCSSKERIFHEELTGLKKTSWEIYSLFNYSDLLACLRGKDYVNVECCHDFPFQGLSLFIFIYAFHE